MIIIWGSKIRKKTELHVPYYTCTTCHHQGLYLLSAWKWFTLFFIPICPIDYKIFYLFCDECDEYNGISCDEAEYLLENIPHKD